MASKAEIEGILSSGEAFGTIIELLLDYMSRRVLLPELRLTLCFGVITFETMNASMFQSLKRLGSVKFYTSFTICMCILLQFGDVQWSSVATERAG